MIDNPSTNPKGAPMAKPGPMACPNSVIRSWPAMMHTPMTATKRVAYKIIRHRRQRFHVPNPRQTRATYSSSDIGTLPSSYEIGGRQRGPIWILGEYPGWPLFPGPVAHATCNAPIPTVRARVVFLRRFVALVLFSV